MNGNHNLTAKAYDAEGNVSVSATISVTVQNADTAAPTITITSPMTGDIVSDFIPFNVSAADNVDVLRVDFIVDGNVIGSATTVPYSISWNTNILPDGTHTLTAKAYDASGNVGTSLDTLVTVQNDFNSQFFVNASPSNVAPSGVITVTWNVPDGRPYYDWIGMYFVDEADVQYLYRFYTGGAPQGTYTLYAPVQPSQIEFRYFEQNTYHQLSTSNRVIVGNGGGDAIAPTVSITAPVNGATVSNTVNISANASDNVGVTRVDFFVDGIQVGSDPNAPYSASWNSASFSNGPHTLIAKAYDAAGNVGTSAPVTVNLQNVVPDTISPTVTITAPANGAIVSNTISVSADATDNIGVVKVDFFVDGNLINSDPNSPYSISWDTKTVTNGVHILTAKAYDAAGNVGTSAPVNITVQNTIADTTAPTVNITAPSNGATVLNTITISADATDNVGVAKVDFFVDGNLIGSDTSSPYSVSWDTKTTSNGAHSLTAKAYDAAGNVGTSPAVNITVQNPVPDITPPSVNITAPINNTVFRGTITLSANAADNVGVTKVEFYSDGTLIDNDTSSPYTISWDTVAVASGPHVLTAKAYDAAGNIGTSAAINVIIDTTAPTASIRSPFPGATVTSTATITADANDNVAVARVDFFVDGVLLGSDTTRAYTIAWNTITVSNGPHKLLVKAYDLAGNETISVEVNVIVQNTLAGLAQHLGIPAISY